MTYRLTFSVLLGFVLLSFLVQRDLALGESALNQSGSRPNIVFVMADDMGWGQPGFNGGDSALTPQMDALAGEGMRLEDFYTHSVCAPTRAAFMTGKYAFRTWSDWRSEDFGKPRLPSEQRPARWMA